MLKKNFLRKWITKFKLLLFVCLFFLLFIFLSLNIVFVFYKEYLKQEIQSWLGLETSIEEIYYVVPNIVFLKGVSIQMPSLKEELPKTLKVSRVFLHISLCESWEKRRLQFYKMRLRQAYFVRKPQEPAGETIIGDFTLVFKQHSYALSGWIDKIYMGGKKQKPLQVLSEFRAEENRLFIDSAVFKNKDLYFQFWGDLLSYKDLSIKGFAFSQTGQVQDDVPSSEKFTEQFKQFINRIFFVTLPTQFPKSNVYILDINSKIKIDFPQLEIHDLSFSLNNFPARGSGEIRFMDFIKSNFNLEIGSPYSFKPSGQKLNKTDLQVEVVYDNGNLFWEGNFLNEFEKNTEGQILSKVYGDFKGLHIFYDDGFLLTIKLDEARVNVETEKRDHSIFLDDLKVIVQPTGKYTFFGISGPFYDGSIKAKVWEGFDEIKERAIAQINLYDVDAHQLDNLIKYFSKIKGRLFGTLVLKDEKEKKLRGSLRIKEGVLERYEFFEWLADSFDLESLRTVRFDKANANVEIGLQQLRLYDISLESEDVKVRGDYQVGTDGIVTSKVSLILSRKLLEESKKFNAFLQQCSNCADELAFDFQLSGDMDALNFQWTPSELKTKIQEWMPNFIERKLEKDIEQIIDPPQEYFGAEDAVGIE